MDDYDVVLILRASVVCRRLYTILKSIGVNVVGDPYVRIQLDNKLSLAVTLSTEGIDVPRSMFSQGIPDRSLVEGLGEKVVVKPLNLSNGRGVELYNTKSLNVADREQLYQEYIDCGAEDERWLVVNGEIVCAMRRKAIDPDEFRSNIAQGGMGIEIDITDGMRQLTKKIYDLFPGAVYYGMDVFRIKDGEGDKFVVNELNYIPGERIIDVTGHNYYDDIYNYIKSTIK